MEQTVKTVDEIRERIAKALESIRPFLIADGGDLEIVEVTPDLDVKVRLLGNCETCPMSFSTLKAGVEETIRKSVPEVRKVIEVHA